MQVDCTLVVRARHQSQDSRLPLPVFPVIMQALSSTHANFERHAQHHLPNYGRERAPSSASLHPDLPLTRRRSSGGHLAQVALLQGGPPGPRGQPHHRSEELGDISFWPSLQFSMGEASHHSVMRPSSSTFHFIYYWIQNWLNSEFIRHNKIMRDAYLVDQLFS